MHLYKIILMRRKIIKQPPIKFGNQENQSSVQNYIRQQLYTKGFAFNAQVGPNSFDVVLGGAARRLFGIVLFSDPNFVTDPDIFSMTLNQEVIVDKVAWWAYNPQGAVGNLFKKDQFFELPRPLSGSDSCQIQYTAINAHKIYPVFYLADEQS